MTIRWDLETAPTADSSQVPDTVLFYLWGFLVVFAIAVALGGWAWRSRHDSRETLWTYFVMAMLWPLFVCAVLFLILWTALTKSERRQ